MDTITTLALATRTDYIDGDTFDAAALAILDRPIEGRADVLAVLAAIAHTSDLLPAQRRALGAVLNWL
ncbi:hypothetical protein CU669_20425 [Paramagnetospirillum kuznetsovii]|uniref:Uncharacterized protein n=1 Tax=Paramagnetospirillum kuznetsovii TaxID=2053833 RepID=A0A364NSM6_9PROT|nr:hypothetical protein [Paramagnetospirillum kuznetsovii]RAU20074.1 hypothetical protein CU669_20425 [Paramagnetospirillum kuznetsovii]